MFFVNMVAHILKFFVDVAPHIVEATNAGFFRGFLEINVDKSVAHEKPQMLEGELGKVNAFCRFMRS